jgi:hypothetical protein
MCSQNVDVENKSGKKEKIVEFVFPSRCVFLKMGSFFGKLDGDLVGLSAGKIAFLSSLSLPVL